MGQLGHFGYPLTGRLGSGNRSGRADQGLPSNPASGSPRRTAPCSGDGWGCGLTRMNPPGSQPARDDTTSRAGEGVEEGSVRVSPARGAAPAWGHARSNRAGRMQVPKRPRRVLFGSETRGEANPPGTRPSRGRAFRRGIRADALRSSRREATDARPVPRGRRRRRRGAAGDACEGAPPRRARSASAAQG